MLNAFLVATTIVAGTNNTSKAFRTLISQGNAVKASLPNELTTIRTAQDIKKFFDSALDMLSRPTIIPKTTRPIQTFTFVEPMNPKTRATNTPTKKAQPLILLKFDFIYHTSFYLLINLNLNTICFSPDLPYLSLPQVFQVP